MDGVRNIACCSKGTRPGDPLADIIFNLGMTFILSELDTCREQPPSVRWEPMGGPFFGSPGSSATVSCPEVSYVDDFALFISHDSPGKLCDRVVDIAHRLTKIMASFGLELNMKAGKTECILSLRGRGTADTQRQLARHGKQIVLPTKYAKLRIFQNHCHLGTILTKTGCITPEIAKRCKAMLEAYLPIAHRVFASREISRSTKMQSAHVLLDGILFYGAATWPELSEGCLARLDAVRCKVLCKICQHFRGLDGDGWTDRASQTAM